MMPHESSDSYEILWLPEAFSQIVEWKEQAISEGFSRKFANALRKLLHRLETAPLTFGDPIRDFAAITTQQRRALIPRWFFIWFSVDYRAHVVVVHSLKQALRSRLL